MQMIHATSTAAGNEFFWKNAGDVDEDVQQEFDRLLALDITDLL